MGKKIGLATLAGFVALMIAGFLIWGLLLANMFSEMLDASGGCITEPEMTYIALSSLVQALLLALILDKFGAHTVKAGAMAAAWIMLLISIAYGLWGVTSSPGYEWSNLVMDGVTSIVMGAIGGAAIGWTLSKVK
jgi:hypothetical protein